jgi:uncharacterized protein YdhG (YjbR/CyaY superfamily)
MMSKQNNSSSKDVDFYIAGLTEPAKSTLIKLREMTRKLAPEAEEYMSYGMPAFRHNGPLIAYAAYQQHVGLYPMNGSLTEDMKEELKAYKTSKGAVQFPLDKSIPAGLLKKIVNKRLKENKENSAEKRIKKA